MDIEEEVGAKGDKHMRGTGDEDFAVTGPDTESLVEPAPPGASGSSEAHIPPTLPPATLPDILITEAIGGHLCKCKDCSPKLAQTLYQQAKDHLIKEETVKIQEDTRDHLTKEVRVKYYPEAKRKADEQVLVEVRTKKWDEERLALQAQVRTDMLPLLREEVAEEYHGDLKDAIQDQLMKEVTNRVQ